MIIPSLLAVVVKKIQRVLFDISPLFPFLLLERIPLVYDSVLKIMVIIMIIG